jgi:signal transduction histidine kinase/ActR/RegA family two-component response regulator
MVHVPDLLPDTAPALVQRLPVFVLEFAADGACRSTWMSPAATALLGIADEPAASWGDRLLDRLDPGQRAAAAGALQAARRGRDLAHHLQLADGRQLLLMWTAATSADGCRCDGMVVDLTASRQAEQSAAGTAERIRRQNEILHRISLDPATLAGEVERQAEVICAAVGDAFAIARVGVWLFDTDGSGLRCLDLYECGPRRHSGGGVLYEAQYREEFAHLRRSKFVAADDPLSDPRTAGYVDGYLRPLGISAMLDGVIRLDGRSVGTLCCEHVGRPHRWTGDEIAFVCQLADQIGLALSNRARHRAEAARRELERGMLELQKLESLGLLAGGLAHDFNNLLGVIQGNAELARRRLGTGDPAAAALARIETASSRAADLCRQMLAYAGKGRFITAPLDLGALVAEMADLLGATVARTAVLDLDLAPGLPPVEGDATQLRQVVMNLITNASDALGGAPGTIRVSTALRWCRADAPAAPGCAPLPAGRHLELAVSDTGCGMDQATIARVFEPFFTTKATGRGLGLAAVQGIVRGHHGAIAIDSQPGGGTTFRVLLPPSERPIPAGEPPRARGALSGRVLVVDDEAPLRDLAREMLAGLAVETLEASDGLAAVEVFLAERRRIDLVLLDLTMPRLGGVETLRRLRAIDPAVRAVVTSGYTAQEIGLRFGDGPPDGFLHKPYTQEALAAAVQAAMRPGTDPRPG